MRNGAAGFAGLSIGAAGHCKSRLRAGTPATRTVACPPFGSLQVRPRLSTKGTHVPH